MVLYLRFLFHKKSRRFQRRISYGMFYKVACFLVFMKRGLVGIIILGVLGFLLVVGIGAGIYFYNYYVFKEVRACIGEGVDSKIPCDVRQDCVDLMVEQGMDISVLDGAPDFVRENFDAILGEAIYCDGSCFVGEVRGIDYETGELVELERCLDGENEFVMEVRGREGIEILQWMRDMKKS